MENPNQEGQEEHRLIEGRNAVMEALRSGVVIDRLLVLRDDHDGPLNSILKKAKSQNILVDYVNRQHLNQRSETGKHQGVIAYAAAYAYATVEEILQVAKDKGEAPFLFLLDHIEDPHNVGAIIRTANVVGAHGVILPNRRAASLTQTVAKAAAGALEFTKVAKVTNLTQTIEDLKKEGLWFVCADMDGTPMADLSLKGPIGLVMGNEGCGVSPKIREHCDMTAAIPMFGQIDSLNVSVATGVLAYEILRQRMSQ